MFRFDLNEEVSFSTTGTIVTRSERNDRNEPQYVVRQATQNGGTIHRTFSESELTRAPAQTGADLPPGALRRVA